MLVSPLELSLIGVQKGSVLVLTGHSAGAAIASLLYALLRSIESSSLSQAVAEFDKVHCIVFGAPPIPMEPLLGDVNKQPNRHGSLFLSFINGGDPITKAPTRYSESDVNVHLAKRLFVNSGVLLSMRRDIAALPRVRIRMTDNSSLGRDRAMAWSVHSIKVYRKRVVALMGESTHPTSLDGGNCTSHISTSRQEATMNQSALSGWFSLMFI